MFMFGLDIPKPGPILSDQCLIFASLFMLAVLLRQRNDQVRLKVKVGNAKSVCRVLFPRLWAVDCGLCSAECVHCVVSFSCYVHRAIVMRVPRSEDWRAQQTPTRMEHDR
jgi:hypothetical protein